MTEHQKVHPVDVEAPAVVAGSPTAPLMPRDSSRSEKGDPAHQPSQGIPPPYRRTIPHRSLHRGLKLTVNAQFDVTVTTRNPNKRIGIYYEDGSHLSVLYDDTVLVKGAFPSFYQGHHNTTVVDVIMTGQTQMGSSLITSLQAQQQTGTIPLVFKGDVPVRVKFGALKLWKIRFRVTCDLVVNSLTANNKISIRSSKCRFRLKKLF
ncbi:hypothetical protein QJS10_CPB11g02345 [Acorus calamus]|uniref:Late embryogenesis abundant protein LEA-2 subgroup domain-containing protein n=1 Tax=Acorus calamus TaxID=4465 RepID=A0AAV9DRD2_ACOCL|nr:hypothetical protein QJS10_CPB11g02345 [Acorus calamus]